MNLSIRVYVISPPKKINALLSLRIPRLVYKQAGQKAERLLKRCHLQRVDNAPIQTDGDYEIPSLTPNFTRS